MTRKARGLYICSAVIIAGTAVLVAANFPMTEPRGLTVHEWGTFTSVAGEDGAAIRWDVLGGKDDLPSFVNDRGYRGFKSRLSGTVRMETPVLYFYSPRELQAHVRVAFPKGLITEWYPQAEYQIDQKNEPDAPVYRLPANLNGLDTSMRSVTGGIEWKDIKVEPGTAPDLPVEGNPSRYYAARATDAAPLAVGDQHEKFLFYRGVGSFRVPLSARLSKDGKVVLETSGADVVPLAILFESREGRIGYRVADAVSGSLTLNPPSLDADFSRLTEQLENTLVTQGLFRKEAQAMIETWRDAWFEEGSRVIYMVPRRILDAVLGLQVDPVPSQILRVFVGRIELITPETERSVEAAISANDLCALDRYSRFLEPILERLQSHDPAAASEIEHFEENAGRFAEPVACP